MIRIKILKDYKQYKKDDVVNGLTKNEAFGLIDKGVAMISKDMTEADTVVARPFQKRKKLGLKNK